jgi:hypothetical protein
VALTSSKYVDAATPLKRIIPERKMLWPTARGYGENAGSDASKFPGLMAIKARRGEKPPEALAEFVEAAWAAQDRILILDDFLFKPKESAARQRRYDQILSWFPDRLVANDIRFLTNTHEDAQEREMIRTLFAERAAAINRNSPRRVGQVTIDVRFSLNENFPYVHDRFAIIDSELWHFGATVGGLHHDLSVATRGWDSEQYEALQFFDLAWNGDNDLIGGGPHG